MKAFIFDPLWDDLVTPVLLKQLKEHNIEITVVKEIAPLRDCPQLFEGTEERLLCINPDYVNWKLEAKDYRDIPGLKAILISITSFSWIDRSYADSANIAICNVRNFSTQGAAEWAIMMMLCVARQIPRLLKDGFPLDFDKDFRKYQGLELRGKTAAIIGLGNNGSAIAERCSGLGMNVIYWSRSSRNRAYTSTSLKELFATADVIFPTFAKSNDTNNLITNELLASVKSSAIIIDTIELERSKETILKMVRGGNLFGYGFEAQPEEFNHYQGNIWAAPAYAWVTGESMINTIQKWTHNMINAAYDKYPTKVN